MKELEQELSATLNRYSAENKSDTPDFLLARYLITCLAAYNACVNDREVWYGRHGRGAAINPPGTKP
jgi:hypothetical protein